MVLTKHCYKKITVYSLIFQVNREKQALEVDEELENVELEELQDILPSHQPRFIVYRYANITILLIFTLWVHFNEFMFFFQWICILRWSKKNLIQKSYMLIIQLFFIAIMKYYSVNWVENDYYIKFSKMTSWKKNFSFKPKILILKIIGWPNEWWSRLSKFFFYFKNFIFL